MNTMQANPPTAKEIWNGIAGQNWVEAQVLLDSMFKRFEDIIVTGCLEQGARHVLDVGCGTGATTLALADRLREAGGCTGIDISDPMIELARKRAVQSGSGADFICADAEDHPLGIARYDRIVSRFGVMFFRDPVRAFANLRRASAAGAQLAVIAWRDPAENPFMTAAEAAVRPLLPEALAAALQPTGQFAFADENHVRGILRDSGWSGVTMTPLDVACSLPEDALETWLTRLGPLGRLLPELDPGHRAAVIDAARSAYAPYVDGDMVRFTAACWAIGGENV
ncbi:class I SAM-dependent methyltransferase [Maricaulis sp.]|uniref:class I SAM-dependent methyltransferase n=1 Tax=Maricaulis sp. TaxID=1486257 RepID=UPI001B1EAE0E|nr:class I SAM-dependent methyltransferase [Maricaulis sp.]MBO6764391.1 class I SAM-dependent methyltransferase [Maricaulis sp.]